MLSLLAGPFPLVDHDTEDPTEFGAYLDWHDSAGLISYASIDGVVRGVVATLDGRVFPRNSSQVQGGIGYNFRTSGLTVSDGNGIYAKLNLLNLRGEGEYTESSVLGFDAWSLAHDRWVKAETRKVYHYDPDLDDEVEEHDFGGSGFYLLNAAKISPAPTQGRCFMAFADGNIVEYDLIAREPVAGVFREITENIGAWYSPHLGVFVSVHEESSVQVVRVWANEEQPASIAEPSLASGTLFPGSIARLTTTVAGAGGRPCPGLNVAFSAGVGTILDPVVATDDDGEAEARVMIGLDEVSTELFATVEVRF